MKKYSIFNLFVVEVDEIKFICEFIQSKQEYREILTSRKISLKNNYTVEKLSDYYSTLVF